MFISLPRGYAKGTGCEPDVIYLFNCEVNACLEEGLIFSNDYVVGYGCVSDFKLASVEPITPERLIKTEGLFYKLGVTHSELGFYQFTGEKDSWTLEKLPNPESLPFKEFAEKYEQNLNASISHKIKRIFIPLRSWWSRLAHK